MLQGDTVIGGYQVKKDGTLFGALRQFGLPTRKVRDTESGWNGCEATWRHLGLRIYFYNLGGHDPCQPQYGYFRDALITEKSWRTASGLRIGDPMRWILRYHPKANRAPRRVRSLGSRTVDRATVRAFGLKRAAGFRILNRRRAMSRSVFLEVSLDPATVGGAGRAASKRPKRPACGRGRVRSSFPARSSQQPRAYRQPPFRPASTFPPPTPRESSLRPASASPRRGSARARGDPRSPFPSPR